MSTVNASASYPRQRLSALSGYRDAARLLGVPEGTLRRWVAENRVPHVRLGPRTVRFKIDVLEGWIEAHAVSAMEDHLGA